MAGSERSNADGRCSHPTWSAAHMIGAKNRAAAPSTAVTEPPLACRASPPESRSGPNLPATPASLHRFDPATRLQSTDASLDLDALLRIKYAFKICGPITGKQHTPAQEPNV